MARKLDGMKSTASEGKQLINIGEQRRDWIRKVHELADAPINEVMRCIIDQVSVEDPESYAGRIRKYQAKQRLFDIERRERDLKAEKEKLVSELEKHVDPARLGR